MAGELTVEVVSRFGGEAWSGRALRVSVPLVDGELGVLPGRQPILAILGRGQVRIVPAEGQEVSVAVAGGFFSVDHDVVTVAADVAGDEAANGSGEVSDVLAEAVELPGMTARR